MMTKRVSIKGGAKVGGVVLPDEVRQRVFRMEQFVLLLEVAVKDAKGGAAYRTHKFRDMAVLERVGFVENLGFNERQLEVRLSAEGRNFVEGAVKTLASLDDLALAEGAAVMCDGDGNLTKKEG